MEKRKIIAIVGPTASGKTGWGVSIARKYNGEIISADSRQVYKKLDIGTGKDLGEYGEIKYHLIDICQLGEKFTMFDWLERARIIIEDIFACGKTPIIVGGTGLYVQALVEGFELEKCQISNSKLQMKCHPSRLRLAEAENQNVKKYSREELEKKSVKQLQKIFSELEIRNSKLEIDLNNPHRLIRAIERAQSGEIVSKEKPDFEVLQIAIDLPREIIYQRIDDRVDDWFEQGFMEEVQGLLDSGVDPKWLEKIGLEYRILAEFLLCHSEAKPKNPDLSLIAQDDDEFRNMKQRMKFAIHAYARRQLTWFRRFPEVVWCADIKSAEKEIKKFLV